MGGLKKKQKLNRKGAKNAKRQLFYPSGRPMDKNTLYLDNSDAILKMYIKNVRFRGCDMPEINITELRKRLPHYLKQVELGTELRVTSRGRVIARIIPEKDEVEAARNRLMKLRGTVIKGDIIEPVKNTNWTADADNL